MQASQAQFGGAWNSSNFGSGSNFISSALFYLFGLLYGLDYLDLKDLYFIDSFSWPKSFYIIDFLGVIDCF